MGSWRSVSLSREVDVSIGQDPRQPKVNEGRSTGASSTSDQGWRTISWILLGKGVKRCLTRSGA